MKKLLMIVFAAALTMGTAWADDDKKKDTPKKKGGRGIVALVKQLDLNADQKKTLNAFLKENRKRIEAKLKEILNEEQQAKLKELVAKNKPKRKKKDEK
jgi:Spy/CpxP family protein refolding chaperone